MPLFIPESQFEAQHLCFQSNFPLMCLRIQRMVVQVSTLETWVHFLTLGFFLTIAAIWGLSQWVGDIFLSLPFPISVILMNK